MNNIRKKIEKNKKKNFFLIYFFHGEKKTQVPI